MKRSETTSQALSKSCQLFAITEFLSDDGVGLYKNSAVEARRLGFSGFRTVPSAFFLDSLLVLF